MIQPITTWEKSGRTVIKRLGENNPLYKLGIHQVRITPVPENSTTHSLYEYINNDKGLLFSLTKYSDGSCGSQGLPESAMQFYDNASFSKTFVNMVNVLKTYKSMMG